MRLLSAALWVAASWTLLASGLGPVLAFSLAAGSLLVTRRVHTRPLPASALIACVLAGAFSYPLWAGAVTWSGGLLGLASRASVRAPGLLEASTMLTAGPIFEELLYRERLLPAVERCAGTGIALLASTAAFALPHLDPWSTLAAAWVGPALGTLYLITRNVWACVGAHAGVNAAALWVATL